MPEELVTATQAGEILGVHRSVVHYLAQRGELQEMRFPPTGKEKRVKVFFRRSEVEALGNSWRQRAPRQPRRKPGDESSGGSDAANFRLRKVGTSRRLMV